jgi:hypothetical protein
MEINKRLYFLHIPKTGGTTVAANFGQFLISNTIPKYPPSNPPHSDVSNEYAFIQGHLGRYPISVVDNLSVATLLRDPLDRAISNFLYIHDKVLIKREEYYSLKSMTDKLRHYLFEDEFYFSHRNIQSKFVCLDPGVNKFKDEPTGEELEYLNRSKGWSLPEETVTFKQAKKFIDSFDIVNTTRNVELFISRLIDWFNTNYPELSVKELGFEISDANVSVLNQNGVSITTELLKQSLTDEDILRFLDLNSVDFDLYEYIYNKE